MLGSLLQQQQHASTPGAFHQAMVRQAVPYLMELQAAQQQVAGNTGGLASRLINSTYFNTARPSMAQGTVVPVSISQQGDRADLYNPNFDHLNTLVNVWERQTSADQYVRLDQKLTQAQPDIAVKRNRGTAHSLTRELVHPLTGASTHLINFSYIPNDPSEWKVRHGLAIVGNIGASGQRRLDGNPVYFNAPGQSFRHSTRK